MSTVAPTEALPKATLCISRSALSEQGIPNENARGVYPFDPRKTKAGNYHFIGRGIVDDTKNEFHYAIGCALPQILMYCVVRCGDSVLAYTRPDKGTGENLLKGLHSIGFGGHVDLEDFAHVTRTEDLNISLDAALFETLMHSAHREVSEELGFDMAHAKAVAINSIVVDQSNEVGTVHAGVLVMIDVDDQSEFNVQESEVHNLRWEKIADVKAGTSGYENWSQIVPEFAL